MYFIGGDHYNNRIPHEDLQIFCHRVYARLPYNLSDDDLRHRLYTDVFSHPLYTRDDCSLKNFLADCKAKNIVPMVNNNPTFLDDTVPLGEYARRSRIIDQIMYDAGFKMAYQSLMNEPGKRHSTIEYTNYVNAAKAETRHYKIIAGNDEYNMLDWNYLLDNGTFDILGVHPLSSLGYPANWNILNNWADMATERSKPYMITEGGSWFKSYFSLEGYTVIKNLILRAKNLGYLATLIVLLDVNEGSYPKLGFRRFTKDYKTLTSTSDYWDDFIALANREGNKYIQPIVEDDDMKLDSLYYKDRPIEKYVRDPAGRGIMFLRQCFKLSSSNVFDAALDSEVRNYQIANGLVVDGKVGPKTFGRLILEADYQKFYNWIHHDWATYS